MFSLRKAIFRSTFTRFFPLFFPDHHSSYGKLSAEESFPRVKKTYWPNKKGGGGAFSPVTYRGGKRKKKKGLKSYRLNKKQEFSPLVKRRRKLKTEKGQEGGGGGGTSPKKVYLPPSILPIRKREEQNIQHSCGSFAALIVRGERKKKKLFQQ